MEGVARLVDKLAVNEGLTETLLPGVGAFRASKAKGREPLCYGQGVIFVVQGAKRVYLGDQVHDYNPENYLVLSVPVPAECETFAEPGKPLLALTVDMDKRMVSEILGKMDSPSQWSLSGATKRQQGIYLEEMTETLKESIHRLLRILQSPQETQVLGQAALQELFFRILQQENAQILYDWAKKDSNLARIDRALQHIHSNLPSPMSVDDLSLLANMSPSSFHRAFNQVTASSPIQYIKKLRLARARDLIAQQQLRVSEAAVEVGYESATQFSREFKRYYGSSPSSYAPGR